MSATEHEGLRQVLAGALPQAELVRAWRLVGGISAETHALEVREAGATQTLVVRRIGPGSLAFDPRAAEHEFAVRRAVFTAGVPTPEPLAWGDTPWPHLLMTYVEGAVEVRAAPLAAGVTQLADRLARIHALDPGPLGFLPPYAAQVEALLAARPARLDAELLEPELRGAFEAAWPLASRNPVRVLHGDFWPGNVLWRDGALASVLDWEDAALGDPLGDLAVTRLDLLFVAGPEAMQAFTARYAERSPLDLTQLPQWDLFAALRPVPHFAEWAAAMPTLGRDDLTGARMRELHRWFARQALEAARAS